MRRSRVKPSSWVSFLPLGLAGCFYGAFILRSRFGYEGRTYFTLFDDAMISMRYAENLVGGAGFTWSGGERVEGYSNVLWTFLMAVVHLLPISNAKTALVVMLLSAAILVANALVVRRIVEHLAPGAHLAAVIAMTLTAFLYPLAFWALRGMEVGIAALLVSTMALLALRLLGGDSRRGTWSLALVVAAAVLTRDDLAVACVTVIAFLAWSLPADRRRRVLVPIAATLIGVAAAHTAFRLAYYDSLLPNPYYLKVTGIGLGERLERGGLALGYTVVHDLWAPLVLGAAYFALRGRSVPRGAVLLAALFLAQCLYSVYVGGDAWEDTRLANRFVTTVTPLLLALAVLGTMELTTPRSNRPRWIAGAAFLALAPLAGWASFPSEKLGILRGEGISEPRAAIAVAFAAVLGAVSLMLARAGPSRSTLLKGTGAAAIALLLLVQLNARPVREWLRSNHEGYSFDVAFSRLGLVLRDVTPPGTRVALVAAGSTAYFSERPAIDLLGKMDPVIAKGARQPIPFHPGHDKWNYQHSVGRLRPAVVAGLWRPTGRDFCDIATWGYTQAAPRVFLSSEARGIRRRELARSLERELPFSPSPYPACAEDTSPRSPESR